MPLTDRSTFKTLDTIKHVWSHSLSLPGLPSPLPINLPGADTHQLPTSFKIPHLAQASISLSALTAALFHTATTAHPGQFPQVTVPLPSAIAEFHSERLTTLDARRIPGGFKGAVPIGGLHPVRGGRHVRVHDVFEAHRRAASRVVLDGDAEGWRARGDEFKARLREWDAEEFEARLMEAGGAGAALRTWREWDAVTDGRIMGEPVVVEKVGEGTRWEREGRGGRGCYGGVRVVEMTRVIAAPVAGRTLAAHGADVVWVTSPGLQDLPELDRDTGRGKRSVQIDIGTEEGKTTLERLLEDADVLIQSYRPGSLAAKGFGVADVVKRSRKGIVCANLSAYGPGNPLTQRRGFDSLVQTASGMNVAEAERFADGEPSRVAPCQVLDHASGFLVAAGIGAALYRRATEGGSYEVTVSLAGTLQYLRSLGQLDHPSVYQSEPLGGPFDVDVNLMEERESHFGLLRAPKHSADVNGVPVGYDTMPEPLGSHRAEWL